MSDFHFLFHLGRGLLEAGIPGTPAGMGPGPGQVHPSLDHIWTCSRSQSLRNSPDC